jgi:hypothetical protein
MKEKHFLKWVKTHHWDSLEKDKDLILRHLKTYFGDKPVMDAVEKDDALMDDIKNDIERAYQVLEFYGVPRERAHSVHNGIEVLITRVKRQRESERALLDEMAGALKEAKKIIERHEDSNLPGSAELRLINKTIVSYNKMKEEEVKNDL